MKLEFSRRIFEKRLGFIKIRPVGVDLFLADGHEANSRFSQFCESALKTIMTYFLIPIIYWR